jgi:hypothetical protein
VIETTVVITTAQGWGEVTYGTQTLHSIRPTIYRKAVVVHREQASDRLRVAHRKAVWFVVFTSYDEFGPDGHLTTIQREAVPCFDWEDAFAMLLGVMNEWAKLGIDRVTTEWRKAEAGKGQ